MNAPAEKKSKEVLTWRKYPTCLLGFVRGPLRLESAGGAEQYEEGKNTFLFFRAPDRRVDINHDANAHRYAVTHLQTRSRWGILLMWPLCLHVYVQFRYQMLCRVMGGVEPHRVPGSEVIFYARAGARWEAGRALYIWPSAFAGLHWD